MDKPQLELTPFVMTKTQSDRPRWADAPSYKRTRKPQVRARSMCVKIGVCMALLAAVILFEVVLFSRDEPAVQASTEDSAAESGEDTLGRLRFVEAGGVRSVFKTSQRWNAPVAAQSAETLEDGALMKLLADQDTPVAVCASGEVTAIAQDPDYGAYVRVSHGGELESFYYSLADIRVEEGQPLTAQDTLGSVGPGGCVYVRVRRAGAPVDPADFIDTEGLS